jgi:hypothetical protein
VRDDAYVSVISQIPEDLRLLPITQVAAALGCCERVARSILEEENVPLIVIGPRSHGARVSDLRRIIKARERTPSRR